MNRRSFFFSWAKAGAAALWTAGIAGTAAAVKFFQPMVSYEPPLSFKAGVPEDFPVGTPTLLPEENTFIVRDRERGFRACSAVCTHLGCTVRWSSGDQRFYCPCHGSVYDAEGKVIDGPAPRPLDWYEVTMAKDGQLQVDKHRVVPRDKRLIVES
ncbi:MAG: Rieske 2Fe-2S domain-containing protein [Bryobacteraceae bacterium]|nr:Rieske 2Fe-2S domain-containing protein [Bryobacteraceae bacterium]